MGKGIDSLKTRKRSEKLAFLEVKTDSTSKYVRLEGFTTQTFNANASEYSRQYVDEDVKSYAESINYAFDQYVGQEALEEIVKITENELTGFDAVRKIIVADMTTLTGSGDKVPTYSAEATVRSYTIVPSSNGDTTDCMTYSGDFKSRGAKTKCRVSFDSDFQTVKIVAESTVASQSAKSTEKNVEVKK